MNGYMNTENNMQNYMVSDLRSNNDCSVQKNNALRNDWRERTCINSNSNFNYGISSNLRNDTDYVDEQIQQSTAPLQYKMDVNQIKNCNSCFTLNGSSLPNLNGGGSMANIPISNPSADVMMQLTDIDSIMSNRNVKSSKSKRGKVNDVDIFKFKTYDNKICNKFLDPQSSLLNTPKQLYRELSINRFYDFNQNPQKNIYYNDSMNSQLMAKDNYDFPYPYSLNNQLNVPNALTGTVINNVSNYKSNCSAPILPNMALNNSANFEQRMAQQKLDSESDNSSMSSTESAI